MEGHPRRILDLTRGPGPIDLTVEAGTAYEFLLGLVAFCNRDGQDTYEVGKSWFDRARQALPDTVLSDAEQLTRGFHKLWGHLLGLVQGLPSPWDVPAFLARLEGLPALEIKLHLLGYHLGVQRGGVSRDVIRRAAEGDQEAARAFRMNAFPADTRWQAVLEHLLQEGHEATKRRLLSILTAWYDRVFRPQEAELARILRRDAEAKRMLVPMVPHAQLIEAATQGLEYTPEPYVSRVMLIPTVLLRPYVLISEYREAKLICYPVADEAVDAGRRGSGALVRVLKALADPHRLEALRLLARRPHSLQELVHQLGLAPSTVHHHLVLLRAAGLVRVREADKRYSLRAEQLPHTFQGLLHHLGLPVGDEGPK